MGARAHRAHTAARAGSFADAVRERFPGIPAGEEHRVARFACARRTERVGVLCAGGGHYELAVELAVVAHVRHRFTAYERLLERGVPRERARALVAGEVSRVLRAWGAAQPP